MAAAIRELIAIVALATNNGPMATGVVVLFYVGGLMALILFGVVLVFFKTWIRALAAGVGVSFGTLIGMRLRNVPAGRIVEALITVHKAGMSDVTIEILERHHLAGGNVTRVARALAAARVAGIDLTFEHAAAIDLDGRDVFAEVQQAAGTIPTLEA